MKKIVTLMLAVAMVCTISACGKPAPAGDSSTTGENGTSYKIAIVQQLDHASLNEIRTAIETRLDALAAEKGIAITYTEFNGQNDPTVLNQIGTQVVTGEYDAIIPIATTAAQCMMTADETAKIPIIYAAISDPESAGLTDVDYVTGVSDKLKTGDILDMMFALKPDLKTVGLLYSLSEVNSSTPIAEAKKYLDEKGIAYVEKTGNTNDEILAAAASLTDQAEAVFTPTDNVVMAAELSIAETLAEAGIPHYTGADSFVRNGAFATRGVNYSDLGTRTAELALEVLETKTFPDYLVMEGDIITVNTETAKKLNLDYNAFREMAPTLKEAQTSAD